jgi:hypothetical protein
MALGDVAQPQQRSAQRGIRGHEERGIVQLLGQAQALLAQLARGVVLRADRAEAPQAPQHREQLRRLAERLAQLAGAGVGTSDLRGALPFGRHQRRAERDLESEFLLCPLGRIGQARQHLQPLAEMRDRLHVSRAFHRALAGALPVADRLLLQIRPGIVPGQQLRLGFGEFREVRLQHLGDAGVQLAPSAAQQALIGRVPHQRVLEGIERSERVTPAKHQLGGDQLLERGI